MTNDSFRDTETIHDGDDPSRQSARLKMAAVGAAVVGLAVLVAIAVTAAGRYARLERRLDESDTSAEIAALRRQVDRLEKRLDAVSDPGELDRLRAQVASLTDPKAIRTPTKPETKVDEPKVEPKTKTEPVAKTKVEPKTKTEPVTKIDPKVDPKVPAIDVSKLPPAGRKLVAALGPGEALETVQDGPAALAAYRELSAAHVRGDTLPAELAPAMAKAALMAGNWNDAVEWARRAGASAPADRRTAANKIEAMAAFRAGRWADADKAAERALVADDKWPAGHRIRVRSLIALQRLSAAELAAAEGLRRTAMPSMNLETGWVRLAQAHELKAAGDEAGAARRAGEAVKAFESGAVEGASWDASYGTGAAHLAAGKPADAVAPLTDASRRKPRSSSTWNLLADALAGAGKPTEAAAALDRAAEIARGSDDDTDSAPPVARRDAPVGAKPNEVAAHASWRKGRILLDAGKPAEALDAFSRAYQLKGDFARAFEGAAEALIRLKKPGEALDALRDAVDTDPTSGRAHLLRAIALCEVAALKQRPPDAAVVIAAVAKAIELDGALKAEAAAAPSLAPVAQDKRFLELLK